MQKPTKKNMYPDHIQWLRCSEKSHSKNAKLKRLDLRSEPDVALLLHQEEPALQA